jgi:hypothetical protein
MEWFIEEPVGLFSLYIGKKNEEEIITEAVLNQRGIYEKL